MSDPGPGKTTDLTNYSRQCEEVPTVLGHRGDYVRESHNSPPPVGYEDVDPRAFIETKRNGQPVTYHRGAYYTRSSGRGASWKSWAADMNDGGNSSRSGQGNVADHDDYYD
jgi:hypothetical protein